MADPGSELATAQEIYRFGNSMSRRLRRDSEFVGQPARL